MADDERLGDRERDARARKSIETAIGSVEHTIELSEQLRTMPDHEGDAEERIISGEQELALLEAERDLLASGEPHGPEEAAFTQEAARTIKELAEEDRERHEAREKPV